MTPDERALLLHPERLELIAEMADAYGDYVTLLNDEVHALVWAARRVAELEAAALPDDAVVITTEQAASVGRYVWNKVRRHGGSIEDAGGASRHVAKLLSVLVEPAVSPDEHTEVER